MSRRTEMGHAFYDCNEVLLSTRTNVLLKNREAPVVPPFLVGTCLFSIEQSASFKKRLCFLYIQRSASLREHPYFIISFFWERSTFTDEAWTCHVPRSGLHVPRSGNALTHLMNRVPICSHPSTHLHSLIQHLSFRDQSSSKRFSPCTSTHPRSRKVI